MCVGRHPCADVGGFQETSHPGAAVGGCGSKHRDAGGIRRFTHVCSDGPDACVLTDTGRLDSTRVGNEG
jgi:hypothetical protein